jgi:hypothetical protein
VDNRSAPNGRTGCPGWNEPLGTVPAALTNKRLRYFVEREPAAVTAVLHIFLRVVETHLRRSSPGASARARFGAVSLVHRFGAALNRHLHYHCCILDGVFEPPATGGVQFRQAAALTPDAVATITEQVRRRVLRWFAHRHLLDPDDARDRLTWEHGGFSLDASVCIASHDRAGLERLLRCYARPPFALERIQASGVTLKPLALSLPAPFDPRPLRLQTAWSSTLS